MSFLVLLGLTTGLKAAPWQVGPCGRGGLCGDNYTPVPTPTQTATWDPLAPTLTPALTPTASRTSVPNALELRIDVGSDQPYSSAGLVWSADGPYNLGGGGFVVPYQGQVYSSAQDAMGTGDPALYRTLRQSSGPLRYRFDVPAGSYEVTFSFADFSGRVPGQRKLTLRAQGQLLRSNLDLVAEAGPAKALDLRYDVTIPSAGLDVEVEGTTGRALLNAIQIRGLQAGPVPTPTPSPTFTPNPTPLHFQLLLPQDAVELP